MKLHSNAACIALICLSACAAVAEGQVSQAESAKAIDWVNNNSFAYYEHIKFAKHPGPAQIPVPPEINPPCHLCGDTATTHDEAVVDAWIESSEQPEKRDIVDLLTMDKQIVSYKADGEWGKLSAAAQDALRSFSQRDVEDAVVRLADRLLNDKALPMGRKYDNEPKRSYAGIRFLAEATRTQELLVGLDPNRYKDTRGFVDRDDETFSLMGVWIQSTAYGIEKDIEAGHQYNLCPVYISTLRSAQMVAGQKPNMQKVMEMIQKIDKLMRFNVQMRLHAQATDEDDGGHYDISWSATARLHLKVDLANACYTPEFLDNGQMAVSVDGFSMVDNNGATIELTSARTFRAPLGKPTLNLCDANPVLLIPFNPALMPRETLRVDGHTKPSMLFGGFLQAVVTPNDLNTQETNEATGRNGAGPATPDDHSSDGHASAQMEKTKALLEAHEGDTSWLMSAEGKAAIAKIQSQAMAMVRPKVAPLNTAAGNARNLADMAAALQSAQLKWTNGSAQPVGDTLKMDDNTHHYSLEIKIRQAPE